MSPESIDQQTKLKVTIQIYKHAPSAIYASILNTFIILFVFHDKVNPYIGYGWSAASIVAAISRLLFIYHVQKKKITIDTFSVRLQQFIITACISGIVFGSAGILFLSPERPAYNAFIYFTMGGMFTGALGAYAINKIVFVSFSAPIILPVTVYCFMLGGEINTAMATMGVIFILSMIVVVLRMNFTIKGAIKLSIENSSLAKKTERLNTELRISNEKFQELSYSDMLTKIKNRRFVLETLKNEIDRYAYSLAQPVDEKRAVQDPDELIYGVFIVDIDHFKEVNDTWGHSCGDEMLVQFVKVLKALIRKDDVIARWGGEEFVIVLKHTNPDYLKTFARKVLDTISAASFRLNDNVVIKKTCSLGYSDFPFFESFPQLLSLEQTIEIADQALYYVKENGRNKAAAARLNIKAADSNNLEDVNLIKKNIADAVKMEKIIFEIV